MELLVSSAVPAAAGVQATLGRGAVRARRLGQRARHHGNRDIVELLEDVDPTQASDYYQRMSSATAPETEQVRRFNRVVTQRIGALSDHYLSRSRALGASRVLWEIGSDGCEVRTLRARLAMDSGQLSRLLRSLEAERLIEVLPSPADARIRVAWLTRAGLAERRLLDDRSDELAGSILAPLSDAQRDELLTAMRSVERVVTASLVEVRIVDPTDGDAQRCVRAYVAELDRRSESRSIPAPVSPPSLTRFARGASSLSPI